MADRGIIFSAPMVRALLERQKTQTRRIVKVPGVMGGRYPIHPPEEAIELEEGEFAQGVFHYLSTGALSGPYRLPAAVGDRLWVRENFFQYGGPIAYAADGPPQFPRKMTPSIHMPRWASRLTLIVEAVRVEPLQAISMADCYAEGIQRPPGPMLGSDVCARDNAWNAYRKLWTSLHGAESWDANPAVVAITFRVEKGNIDQMEGLAA